MVVLHPLPGVNNRSEAYPLAHAKIAQELSHFCNSGAPIVTLKTY